MGRDIVGRCQHLFNFLWVDDIIYQSVQTVQPPLSQHVLHKDEVFLREVPELLLVIPIPCISASSHQFRICWWYEAFFSQIPSMDTIVMGYWVVVQVRTIRSSLMHKSKFIMGYMNLRRVLVIPYEMFLRAHLRSTRIVYLIVSGRGIVDGRGCVI